MPPHLQLFLLGSPRIKRHDAPIQVDTRKAIALLAYLALNGSLEGQRRDALAALFWPEVDATHAHAALRRTLSALNKALAGEGLAIDRETVGLESDQWTIDVNQFHARLADCLSHGHPASEVCSQCLSPLAEAVSLYRDGFLSGFTLRDSPAFDDWQFFQAESLRREFASALERLVRAHSTAREYETAIGYARRWLALDPLHEPAHRELMRLYDRAGQRAAALRQYRECVRVLEEELGVPPLEETTALYEEIKEQRKAAGEQHSPAQASQSPLTPTPLEDPRSLVEGTHPHTPPLLLVGRSTEWAALLKAYDSVRADGKFVVLEGEAGIGKTRLAEVFLQHLRRQGAVTISARCYEGEMNLAYGPFIEALRGMVSQPEHARKLSQLPIHTLSEAARLLPELSGQRADLPPSPTLDSLPLKGDAQSRFFEAIRALILAVGGSTLPGLLFLDDLHWADEASLDLLTYLVRRLRGRPLFILAAWRSDELPAGHRLRQLLAEAGRAGAATTLSLSRLSRAAVKELVQATRPSEDALPEELEKRLYQETEGLPFFVVEYLAMLGSNPDAGWSLPGSVRDLLQSRLRAVSETGWQLLSTAAVIGRSFDFDTLQAASGRSDEETVSGLEALIAQGLVQEVARGDGAGAPGYDFNHEKLRTLVYEETSLARRRLLHRRVAEALVERASRAFARANRPVGAGAGQIAQHYRLAGRESEAAQYFKLAGEYARTLYANAEALSHFRAALALGHPEPAALHEAIGDLQTLSGDYAAALTSYETSAALAGPEGLSQIEHKLGNVYHRRGEWPLAESHFQAALNNLDRSGLSRPDRSGDAARARIYADWSLAAHHQGQMAEALRLATQALELAQAADDKLALAQTHNILGVLASSQNNLEQARHHLQQSLELAETLGDLSARVAALNNLARVYAAGGEVKHALTLAETALALCASQGDRHREAALHNNLADLLHAAGQPEAAMAHLKQAVAIFAEIGADPNTGADAAAWQPEIWKLVEW